MTQLSDRAVRVLFLVIVVIAVAAGIATSLIFHHFGLAFCIGLGFIATVFIGIVLIIVVGNFVAALED